MKKGGRGCFRCGSEGHQFFKCPQRQKENSSGWDMTTSEGNRGGSSSIFVMETYVMGVEGAPEGSKLLYYPVWVRKLEIQALLDSGASVSCIDADLADKAGCVIRGRAPRVLLYPDKRCADVRGIAEIEVRGKGYREKIMFWVVKGLGVQLLLGEPWLRTWNPAINWKTKELVFSDGVIWKAVDSNPSGKPQFRKIRPPSERQAFLMVNAIEEEEQDGDEKGKKEELPSWLEDMREVFEEPTGVVQGRLQHIIHLREGAKAYQKAPYRLSPEQKEALHKELRGFKEKGWIRPSTSE